jgi:uncharacterized sulfatase
VYDGVKSVAHYLRPLGYRVALAGKRHVLPENAFPFDYLDEDQENDPDLAAVEAYLKKAADKPSCVFLCFHEPHTPWTKGDRSAFDPAKLVLPPNFVDTEETRRQLVKYYAEVGDLDHSVGKVLATLDRLGIAQNTLLVFAGEQGNAFPFAKWTCYDGGLQSALIARWPGVIAPGTTTGALVEYVDIVPTFIDIAGGPVLGGLDGRSFLPVLRGETDRHKQVVFGIQTTRGITNGSDHYGIRTARDDHYRYVLNLTPEATFANNVTNQKGAWSKFWGTWTERAATDASAKTLVNRYQHRPAEELYEVSTDPFEMNNLADDPALAGVKSALREKLLAWMESQGDQGAATEMIADQRSLKTAVGLQALLANPSLSDKEREALQTAIDKD